jgi:hypothetical protein
LRRPAALGVLAWLCAASLLGCTTVKDAAKGTYRALGDSSRSVGRAFTPDSGLKVKTVLIGVEDPAHQEAIGFPAYFRKTFSAYAGKECPKLVVDEAAGEFLRTPPRLSSGQLDGYSLALMGRQRGVNFHVIGTLSDVRLKDEKTGFWLWKDTDYKIRAVVRVEVVDSATGTKALDTSVVDETEIDEIRHQQLLDDGRIPLSEIEALLARMLSEAGERVCEALGEQPWQGFVVGAAGQRLDISAGGEVGLTSGMLLEVYGPGTIVENKEGRRFLKPGPLIGEARVAEVSADRAQAVLSGPVSAEPGGAVRLK